MVVYVMDYSSGGAFDRYEPIVNNAIFYTITD